MDRDVPMTRVCIRLWEDDLDAIKDMAASGSAAGMNGIIRQIVHSYVVQMKARGRENLDKLRQQA